MNQYAQHFTPTGTPCPSCGELAVISVLNFEVIPQTIITPQKAEGMGKGVCGFSLCLSCLSRRRLVPNVVTGTWEYEKEEGETI